MGAPAAMVEASGFIWEINGQAVKTVPTAAKAPVATKRKSRRVGWSAEDAVVTIPSPFIAAAGKSRPRERAKYASGMACRRPRSPRRQMEHFFDRTGQKSLSRIVLLAPLPDERKPAIGG
jgi:hypothetical protein